MSAPTSRPVLPCVLSVFDGTVGAEYSTWARLTCRHREMPNLVLAQSSTLRIYEVDSDSGTLLLLKSFILAGSVCFLDTLKSDDGDKDGLLVGFSGHPRVAIVSFSSSLLMATSLMDLTPVLSEQCLGSVTPLEQDLKANLIQKGRQVTLCLVLGGGVAVATMTLSHSAKGGGWFASSEEPYMLPLSTLNKNVVGSFNKNQQDQRHPASSGSTSNVASISHGFGDILDATFLEGYLEPTLCLLHSTKLGRTWSGRLGRKVTTAPTHHVMMVTAMSVNVPHGRSAVLWTVQVPADACMLRSFSRGVICVSVNSIMHIDNAGCTRGVLGVNGWVRTTLPPLDVTVQANPWPLPKLAIQLDGSSMAFVSNDAAFVALRGGQLYLLQLNHTIGLLPLGQKLGAIGQVANLLAWPLSEGMKKLVDDTKENLSVGLLFAGSRMGDATLLGYALHSKQVSEYTIKQEGGGTKRKREDDTVVKTEALIMEDGVATVSQEYETILLQEEDALYAPPDDSDSQPDIVPPSDDEEPLDIFTDKSMSRSKIQSMTVVRSLTALDSITCLGPVGPGCEGPLSRPSLSGPTPSVASTTAAAITANAQILPCGHGSSGGLALVTTPGRDDRTVLAEADCLNMKCLFGLSRQKLVMLGMDEGTNVLRLQEEGMDEVDLEKWCESPHEPSLWNANHVLTKTNLLNATELNNEFGETYTVLLVKGVSEKAEASHNIVVLAEVETKLQVRFVYEIGQSQGTLLSTTPVVRHDDDWSPTIYFGCTWSSGSATITTIRPPNANDEEFTGSETVIVGSNVEKMEVDGEDEEVTYYSSDRIVSIDVFVAPKGTFVLPIKDTNMPTKVKKEEPHNVVDTPSSTVIPEFDDEDLELYGQAGEESMPPSRVPVSTSFSRPGVSGENELYFGVCRQSGLLQVYRLPVVGGTNMEPQLVWEAPGCGHGTPNLAPPLDGTPLPRCPRMHKVHTSEFRFFVCGPSTNFSKKRTYTPKPFSASSFRTFCLALETNMGDVYLYSAQPSNPSTGTEFTRIPLGVVGRSSVEQTRHRAKLKRKGILSSSTLDEGGDAELSVFRYNRLHLFSGISGEDGLFAATSRPMWFVAERGSPTFLCHRSRHVAPAGGKLRPIAGFASGLLSKSKNEGTGFLTLHERIGRVGSQRVTVFRGISNVYSPHGLFPGSGLCVEKVPLGVTVRHIQFIDDSSVSSRDHPLYAVLISRELESDQSHLNDDGLTEEERHRVKDEKEAAKVKRQVEADLGGFDIEQEWVEEIERENCFEIDVSIGGAPPIRKSAYALWVVDASNNWSVVDSYELGEYEHGMTMDIMSLTEVADETGEAAAIGENEETDTLFITVGTGVVDQDGEDVASKGRVLLFEVKRHKSVGAGAIADLSLVYEKDITHGPVASLSCLACEGRSRLVIGAGSDVNVEQWGNGKLTQVGFFRAQMHILDIKLFKTFFLLSDAYDSLYFLVWRESDKSLTLLAKDYEPIPVYASGIMSRGGSVSFVCHDDRQNLEFFQYAPGEAAARGGNKLVCRADYHLGSQTVYMQSHYCRSSLLINSATPTSTLEALKQQDSLVGRTDDDQRMGVYFGTSDGGYVAVIPLSEPAYWRLTALQSVLTNALESNCALSHRAWRLYRRTPRRSGCRSNDRKKGVIDGDLLSQYTDLALADQEDLASAIGSTVDSILDNLLELKCSSMVV